MATVTIVKCDGCDRERGEQEDFNMEVKVYMAVEKISGPFDLCEGCMNRLEQYMNPSDWVRSSPIAPRPGS